MDRWHTYHAWAKVQGGGEDGTGSYSGNSKRKPLKLKHSKYSEKQKPDWGQIKEGSGNLLYSTGKVNPLKGLTWEAT